MTEFRFCVRPSGRGSDVDDRRVGSAFRHSLLTCSSPEGFETECIEASVLSLSDTEINACMVDKKYSEFFSMSRKLPVKFSTFAGQLGLEE